MATIANSLVEIPSDDWPKLCELYAKKIPSGLAYNTLQAAISSFKPQNFDNIHIYSLNGDWSDGTFILQYFPFLILNTLNETTERLQTALKCRDVNMNYMFYSFPQQFMPDMSQYFLDSGIKCDKMLSKWYHISRDTIEKLIIDTPTEFTLEPLTISNYQAIVRHMDDILTVYPDNIDPRNTFMGLYFFHKYGIVAFDQNGTLLAWCIELRMKLGMVQVVKEHQNTKFGDLIVIKLAKILAAQNIEVLIPAVYLDNIDSHSFLNNLDPCTADLVYWVFTDN